MSTTALPDRRTRSRAATAAAAPMLLATLARETFQRAMRLAQLAMNERLASSDAAYAGVLLEGSGDGLSVTATDGIVTVRHHVPTSAAEISQPGAVLVPGKTLRQLAAELPPAPVTLQMLTSESVRITAGRSTTRFIGKAASEALPVPQTPEGGWTLDAGLLLQHAERVRFAAATTDDRPVLRGVYLELSATAITMTATNGHVLSSVRQPVSVPDAPSLGLILPVKALALAADAFEAGEAITLHVRRDGDLVTHLRVASASTEIVVALLAGPYPDYTNVVPTTGSQIARVDRDTLMHTLRRVALVAYDQVHRVRLDFAPDAIRFSADTPDLGDSDDACAATFDGHAGFAIGVNAHLLLALLRAIPTSDVRLVMTESERAIRVEPVEWTAGATMDALVMPLRLTE